MSNTVVIGDLGKLNSTTVLKFDGIDDYVEWVETSVDKLTIRMSLVDESSFGFILDNRDSLGGNSYLLVTDIGLWQFVGCTVSINGVSVVSDTTPVIFNTYLDVEIIFPAPSPIKRFMARNSLTAFKAGFISNAVGYLSSGKVFDYIKNSDFSSVILIDHSGNNNDGSILGAQWWKEGVDENYLDPDSYKATLVSPLTEDQNVIYTDGTPYYNEDATYWNPYNQDVTYAFTVVQQSFNQGSSNGLGFGTFNYSFSFSF